MLLVCINRGRSLTRFDYVISLRNFHPIHEGNEIFQFRRLYLLKYVARWLTKIEARFVRIQRNNMLINVLRNNYNLVRCTFIYVRFFSFFSHSNSITSYSISFFVPFSICFILKIWSNYQRDYGCTVTGNTGSKNALDRFQHVQNAFNILWCEAQVFTRRPMVFLQELSYNVH